ncbi:hypothetical protein AB0M43_22355 [Longispora sp. NPDC051575]|uniref:hypothetical protein n=1 Tax=Longispora sp. NPDC051575 TaxID=3154943 RepID=UPI00342C2168
MSEALTSSEYMAATYRIALAETTRAVLSIGRCSDGDRVINYCAGTGEDNLAIAAAVAPTGVVYAVDVDPAKLSRLDALATARGQADLVRAWPKDAMFAADTPHVPTHIACLFGLHRLPDPALATRRWAEGGSPATKLLTADWATQGESTLPAVSTAWTLVTSVTLEFPVPAMVPTARRSGDAAPAPRLMASVVVREWTGATR